MDWLTQNWQSIVTFAIVALTVAIFTFRIIRPKKSGGCGGGCECEAKRGGGLQPPLD
jgi:hypothetical protein